MLAEETGLLKAFPLSKPLGVCAAARLLPATGQGDWSPNLRPASVPALRHGGQVLIFVRREARSAGAPSYGTLAMAGHHACRSALGEQGQPFPVAPPRARTAAHALAMEVQILPFRELERNLHLCVDRGWFECSNLLAVHLLLWSCDRHVNQ